MGPPAGELSVSRLCCSSTRPALTRFRPFLHRSGTPPLIPSRFSYQAWLLHKGIAGKQVRGSRSGC